MAFRNLGRHRRRTLIVGTSVAVGVCAAVIQGGFVEGVRSQMIEHLIFPQLGHLAVSPRVDPGGDAALIRDPEAVARWIREALPRAEVIPGLSGLGMAFGEVTSTARVALFGVSVERDASMMASLGGRAPADPAPLAAGGVYMGAALAERLELDRGDLVTFSVSGPGGALDAMDFEIAEVLQGGAPWQDYFVYMALADLQALMGVEDAVNLLKVRLPRGPHGVDSAVARLNAALEAAGHDVRVEGYREKGKLFMGIIVASRIQAGVIEIILLIAVGLGVAGAQILAVDERRREIGTMAALGTSRALIRLLFLTEGAVLALVAGVIGALIGVGITTMIGTIGLTMNVEAFRWMVGGSRLLPRVNPTGILWTLLELVVVVTLSGLYPALRASRLQPIEAMREGPA